MMIRVAKWKYNSNSPVMFMVDDIANVFIKQDNSENVQIGEDWGHFGDSKNSMWDFLNKNLYSLYPHIKTTFFLVTDKRSAQRTGTDYSYAEAMDKDESFIEFLNMLHKNKKVELAYHGTTHGEASYPHLEQEWTTYKSLDQAVETIEYGKELFKKVLGEYPKGGKYCGYEKGEYGDISINRTGFLWWCRDWDADLEKDKTREDLSYDLEYFDNVLDIPSTIDGSYLSVRRPKFTKKYLITLYKLLRKKSLERDIYTLYNNKQIISIQEHSSPYRTDNKIQYPNIVSDIKNLQYIFKFLTKLDVWYATGTEIAEYFDMFTNIKIQEDKNSFTLLFNKNIRIKEGSLITLIVDSSKKKTSIECKNKEYFFYKKDDITLIDIPVYRDIQYRIKS